MSIRGNQARGLSDRDRQEGRMERKRVAELWLIPRVDVTLRLFMDFFLSVSKWNGFKVVFPNWWQSLEGSLAWDPPVLSLWQQCAGEARASKRHFHHPVVPICCTGVLFHLLVPSFLPSLPFSLCVSGYFVVLWWWKLIAGGRWLLCTGFGGIHLWPCGCGWVRPAPAVTLRSGTGDESVGRGCHKWPWQLRKQISWQPHFHYTGRFALKTNQDSRLVDLKMVDVEWKSLQI